ncbi:MAG: translocation/assembly module TamB domain-containing protein [Pseudohongiella sp.]|nr:translocation/assembly module TamB domain-containing protein [Pseudohongiella sp.]MDP2126008.1 translocation/assembly module TamB domain-containing protein [Pseudohongiella sp.]
MIEAKSPDANREKLSISPLRRALRWAWRLSAAIVALFLVALVTLTIALSTHSGSQWVLAQVTQQLNNSGQSFSYMTADGTFLQGLNLSGVRWQSGDSQLRIEQLHSRWNPMTLLDGEFNLESLRIAGLQLDWTSAPSPSEPTPPFVLDDLLESLLPLPVVIRLSNARLDGASLNMDGTQIQLNALALDGSLLGRRLQINQLLFDSDQIDIQGDLTLQLDNPYPIDGNISWQYAQTLLEGTAAPSGQLHLSGDLDNLQIRHDLRGPAAVQSSGNIVLELALLLNARVDELALRLDLEHVLEAMPVPGADQFYVDALTLRTQGTPEDLGLFAAAHVTATPTPEIALETDLNLRAYLRGNQLNVDELALRTDNGLLAVTGTVTWDDGLMVDMSYEINDMAPDSYIANLPESVSIRDLNSTGEFTLQQLSAEGAPLQIEFTTPLISARLNEYDLVGSGSFAFDGSAWRVDSFSLQSGDNELTLTALLDASQNIQASLHIDAPSLDVIYPELSGRISGNANVTGTANNPVIDVDVSASDISLGDISIPQLTIRGQNRAGMNELEISSSNIRLPIGERSETINRLMLRLRGQPEAHSMLLLADSNLLRLRINADGGLDAGRWQGRLLSSEVDSDYGLWQQTQSSALSLAAGEMSLETLCWQMLDTRLCVDAGLADNNQLEASLSLTDFPLTVFNLEQSEQTIAREAEVNFHPLNAQRESLRLPFSLPADMALLGEFSVQANVSGPLDAISEMQINVDVLSSDGNFYIRGSAPSPELLDGDNAEFDPVSLIPVINQFVWPNLQLSANQTNGIWTANSQITFLQDDPDSTAAAMRGSVEAQVRMDRDQQLQGEVLLDFDDLGWLEGIVPQLSNVTGELAGRMDVAGTLEAPRISADIMLSEAGMSVPALGLNVRGLETTISSDGADRFVITGYAESGDGSLNFSSEIDMPFDDNRQIDLRLAGDNFRIANLSELQLSITPDLRLRGSQQGINLSGQLYIPHLNAEITTLPETAVDVSSDAIVIQAEGGPVVRNAALAEPTMLSGIPLSGDVRLELGDDVRVSGFGLTAQLRGQLDINQRPNATPLTYGELEVVEGSFATYGRTLTIEQGKLQFMGSYDNPAIDIRAVRVVENMRVGVQMNGTIRNINSSLFSTPTMADGDILAVMITGRPIAEIGSQQDGNALVGAITTLGINQGQGITNQIQSQLGLDTFSINSTGDVNDSSLMLGKYITPRIFIRYAVGLFETENSLAIDYTVNDRVKLQATSGQSQSIDLTYTVEQ